MSRPRALLTTLLPVAALLACKSTPAQVTTETAEPVRTEATREQQLAAWVTEHGGERYLVPYESTALWRGAAEDPLVTIVVFADYSPAYAVMDVALDRLIEEHPDVRVVVLHHLPEGQQAAVRAVLAAHAQGRGWEMHDRILAERGCLEPTELVACAGRAGVPDLDRFRTATADTTELDAQAELAERLDVSAGTTTMFVNGAAHVGNKNLERLREIHAAERAIVDDLLEAGAAPGEVYSLFMVRAGFEREAPSGIAYDSPFDGEPLSRAALDSGVIVEEFVIGEGEQVTEGKAIEFWFEGYASSTATQVLGSREKPSRMMITDAARNDDPIATAIIDGLMGMRVSGKRRIEIPEAIVDIDKPADRPEVGNLILIVELVGVTDAQIPEGRDAYSGKPISSKKRRDGLVIRKYRRGEGPKAAKDTVVSVHYIGLLDDGTEFDSSHPRPDPFTFTLGGGGVIEGFEAGLIGARVGELIELVIPPELAYGEQARA